MQDEGKQHRFTSEKITIWTQTVPAMLVLPAQRIF